jgi:hypothetical protein
MERFNPWHVSWPSPFAGFSACRKKTMVSSARAFIADRETVAKAIATVQTFLIIITGPHVLAGFQSSLRTNEGIGRRAFPQAEPLASRRSAVIFLLPT